MCGPETRKVELWFRASTGASFHLRVICFRRPINWVSPPALEERPRPVEVPSHHLCNSGLGRRANGPGHACGGVARRERKHEFFCRTEQSQALSRFADRDLGRHAAKSALQADCRTGTASASAADFRTAVAGKSRRAGVAGRSLRFCAWEPPAHRSGRAAGTGTAATPGRFTGISAWATLFARFAGRWATLWDAGPPFGRGPPPPAGARIPPVRRCVQPGCVNVIPIKHRLRAVGAG